MNTPTLVEWQRIDPQSGMVECWWTHPFLDHMKTWNLGDKTFLEFGAGLGTAWLRHLCEWVDSIEANPEWAAKAQEQCDIHCEHNGHIFRPIEPIADGVPENIARYFELIPPERQYDIISVDGIFRNECLQWALDHFKGRGGILIADNWQQDYVWISPAAEELMKPYPIHRFYQPGHTNHEGRPWNTVYWEIPA